MSKVFYSRGSSVLCLLCCISLNAQGSSRHDFSFGSFYAEGYFGHNNLTSMTMAPVKYRYQWQSLYLTVNTTWIELNGNAVEAISQNEQHRSSGFSDLGFDADYYWALMPRLYLATGAKLKWPLASRASGLSTGERDYEMSFALLTHFPSANVYARVGQQWREDPADIHLHDRQKFFVSTFYRFNDQYSVALSGDYQQAATTLSDAQKNIILSLDANTFANWQISPYLLRGFGQSSPQQGAGIQFRYRYTTNR